MMEYDASKALWVPPRPAIVRAERERVRKTMLPGLVPIIRSGRPSSTVEFLTSSASGTDASSYISAFDGMSLGAENANRVILALINAQAASGTEGFARVVLNGVTMTSIVQGIGFNSTALFAAPLPTGSTTNFTIELESSHARIGVALFRAIMDQAEIRVRDTANTYAVSGGNTVTASIDVGPGILIAGAYYQNNVSASFTWSGITERYDAALEASNRRHSGGCDNISATVLNKAVAAIASPGFSTGVGMIAASFH